MDKESLLTTRIDLKSSRLYYQLSSMIILLDRGGKILSFQFWAMVFSTAMVQPGNVPEHCK